MSPNVGCNGVVCGAMDVVSCLRPFFGAGIEFETGAESKDAQRATVYTIFRSYKKFGVLAGVRVQENNGNGRWFDPISRADSNIYCQRTCCGGNSATGLVPVELASERQ